MPGAQFRAAVSDHTVLAYAGFQKARECCRQYWNMHHSSGLVVLVSCFHYVAGAWSTIKDASFLGVLMSTGPEFRV